MLTVEEGQAMRDRDAPENIETCSFSFSCAPRLIQNDDSHLCILN